MSRIVVSLRGADRVRIGHPWIYRSDLKDIQAQGGDLVAVADPRGRVLAHALFSQKSQIALRIVSRGDAPPPEGFIGQRIATAIAYRAALGIDATAYRLVHGEGDLLPGLVVDRYGDYVVLQALSEGMDRRLDEIVTALVAQLQPAGILARNDPRVRELEGLERRVDVLHGEVPERIQVSELGVRYEVDLRMGQKTGLFLDQRENREAATRYARGRVLDAFSYNGGFALNLAARAESVVALDVSEDAVRHIRENAALNGRENIEARAVNVFDELREIEHSDDRFDLVVLDPPAFAKNRDALRKALTGYKEINLRALKILKPGGVLVTCTCSYHVDEAMFGDVVYRAALDAEVPVAVVEKRMQGRDHPVLLGVPETYYLKCFIVRRVG